MVVLVIVLVVVLVVAVVIVIVVVVLRFARLLRSSAVLAVCWRDLERPIAGRKLMSKC